MRAIEIVCRAVLAAVGLLVCVFLPALAFGNDPGGGTNGVGPNVALTDNGSSITLANGTIAMQITKSSAQVTSMKFLGREMVLSGGNMYFSMDGSSSYENPASAVFWIKTNTADMVDAGFRCTMTSHHAFNVDIHYVLRRGDTGPYVYAILEHPANYADTSYGEWRFVWKMDQDPLERIYVDDLRNWQKPSSYDLAHAEATGIAEIVKLTTGPWAGRYDCKYMYNVEYESVGCYGHASNPNKIGAWAVFGGYDYFNDGPTKQDLAPASGIIHIHFGRNHYNGSSLTLSTNEVWSKIYGPWLLYCNTNSAGGDACWADAKAQVEAEKGAWPYAWLTGNTNYPAATNRGAVSGTFVITDTLKASVNGGGAWIGLVDPTVGDWQFDSKFYQYWSRADTNGNFVISSVRPGTYTLHAFNVGAVGEFIQSNVLVTASATNALGTVTWTVPHVGGYIAWEIGVPDRTAKEFRHGTNYWEPYLWDSFDNEFANPIEYNLDSGNPAWDLNYAHNFYGTNIEVWNWNLNFTLPANPPSSNARLTIATAGGEYAHLYIYVNGNRRGDLYPANAGGNSLLRQGVHDKYGVNYVTFNAATFLHSGTNTIVLQEVSSAPATGKCTMYDYVALEMPGAAPAVQFLSWTGGRNSNAWDSASTPNWYAYGANRSFVNSSKVLFNDTGTNSPSVRLVGTLAPAAVVFNSTKDYSVTGSGLLAGAMTLTKKGPGNLTLSASSTYTGDTIVESGTLTLLAPANLTSSTNITVNSGAKLDASGLVGGLSLVSGQTLEGSGVISGNCTVGAGATVSPGLATGPLTFSNSLTLAAGSMTLMEIGKAPLTNDQLRVTGALTLGGTLTVTNLSGTLMAGDNFKLFTAASYGGAFGSRRLPPLGFGLAWNTTRLAQNGALWVVSTNPPVIDSVNRIGPNVVLGSSGGTPGWLCVVLTAKNTALAANLWTPIATNLFDPWGRCSFTNGVETGAGSRFYRLQVP